MSSQHYGLTTHERQAAEEMNAQGLLRAAARLVERALIKLDMSEAPCPHCDTALFHNRDEARVYERLSDTPTKLRNAADMLQTARLESGEPRQSSRGFTTALDAKAQAGPQSAR